MHSDVRGTAYETELDTPENGACYSAATDIFNGAVGDPLSISSSCDLRRFSESSYGFGAKLFLVIDWNKWQTELSFSQFQHGGDGEYRFVTQQLLLGLSRKFSL
jgi:hypothetical protein